MNPTDGPSFPSPSRPGLTDGLRKKADAAALLGNRILAPGSSSVRRGRGQPSGTSKWRKVFGVERIASLWRIKRGEARVHILLFSREKNTADFPRNKIDLFSSYLYYLKSLYLYYWGVYISTGNKPLSIFINTCTHQLFWHFPKNTKMGSFRFRFPPFWNKCIPKHHF